MPRLISYGFVFFLLTLMSCSFSQSIRTGEMAYERKQYAVAVDLFAKEYQKSSNKNSRARIAYLAGNSHRRLLDYKEAKAWYGLAIENDYGTEALSRYAAVCKNLELYEEAISVYTEIANKTGRNQEIQQEIDLCRAAINAKDNPEDFVIEKISQNTTVSEYSPVIYDNQFLVFTSERKAATGSDVYKWTGEKFTDLFVMMKSGSEVRNFDPVVNSRNNDGTAWFTKDMNTMFFTRCYSDDGTDQYCKLMVSEKSDGIWTEPQVLSFVQDGVNYGHPTLIEDDEVLVFASDLDNPGGTTDLYYSEWDGDNSWSSPEKMPDIINSSGNEKFPVGDGDTLYFSSDYWPGLGGYDIFKTYLDKDRRWSKPENLGYPINSGADDFSFIVDYKAPTKANVIRQGYFVSSRDSGAKDDIYKFNQFKKKEKEPKEEIEEKKYAYLTVNVYAPVFNDESDPNSGVIGRVSVPESLIKLEKSDGSKIIDAFSDVNGFYFTEIPQGTNIKVIAAKAGYLNGSAFVSAEDIVFEQGQNSMTINLKITLNKIYENREINLDNIYYDFDKWDIKPEAKPVLDSLVQLLNDNPQINIQLSSHTDCRGGDEYNETLSQKRAESAVDYIIASGIQANRLVAKGYGASMPVERCVCDNCTEAQHQANRRTTFKIIRR